MIAPRTDAPLALGSIAAERLSGSYYLNGALAVADAGYGYDSPAIAGTRLFAADCQRRQGQDAVDAAAAAQDSWAALPMMQRNRFVQQLGAEIRARTEEFSELIVLESGKTIAHARAEVGFCLSVIETFASSAAELSGDAKFDFMTGRWIVTAKKPVGPSLLISPWNFPLNLGIRKVVTAMLAGCTFIWKPSEKAPLTAMAVGEALLAIKLPTGVGAILPTSDAPGVVDAILSTGIVRKLSFTGSTEVGKQLMKQAADHVLRTSLELGGNGPAVLGRGADLKAALPAIIRARFSNNGQVCTAINRLYVPVEDLTEVTELLAQELSRLQIGWPHREDADIGPLISPSQAKSLETILKTASDGGAVIHRIGTAPDGEGFVIPALVVGAMTQDEICQRELFGPILPLIPYLRFEDAVSEANSTPFGLSAYIFSNQIEEIEYFKTSIRAGMVAINTASPSSVSSAFGGIGWSGFGRENGIRGINEFLDETTFVY